MDRSSNKGWPAAAISKDRRRHGIFSIGLLAGMFFHGQALAQELPVVSAAKPVVRDIVEDDEFVGRFEAVDQVAIRSRVNGYLEEIHFKDGALVNKGDLLFTIDQRPYQAANDAAKSQVDVATSLLDFTTEDTTGQVVEGSASQPVTFEEFWTFTRPVWARTWRLSAIQQPVPAGH